MGAFFGVPISIKDHIDEKGESATVGSAWMAAHYIAKDDAVVVKLMKERGPSRLCEEIFANLCTLGIQITKSSAEQ